MGYLEKLMKAYEVSSDHLFKSSLLCQDIISVVYCLNSLGRHERKYPTEDAFVDFLYETENHLENIKKFEARQNADLDVHFIQVLRYHSEEMKSAKDTLVRRARARSNFDKAIRLRFVLFGRSFGLLLLKTDNISYDNFCDFKNESN